jgi:hypothetical protein
MGRRAVEIVIILLDVLAVVALAVGQTEQPLLEDRVLAIPQRKRKTQPLVIVTEAGKAILALVISARTGLVVGEIVPRIAVLAVVLADRSPLAFAEVRPPLFPGNLFLTRLVEAHFFRCLHRFGARTLRQRLLLKFVLAERMLLNS